MPRGRSGPVSILPGFLLLLFGGLVFSQNLTSLQVDFERQTRKHGSDETVRGTIYYEPAGKCVALVRDPIDQRLIITDTELVVYYPAERKGFRFHNPTAAALPFFQAFLWSLKEDYGLTEIGYALAEYRVRGDTVTSFWDPPQVRGRTGGKFELTYVADRIAGAELKDGSGAVVARSLFRDHVRFGNAYLPLEITTTTYDRSDSTIETVAFQNPRFNLPLPDSAIDFQIPADAKLINID